MLLARGDPADAARAGAMLDDALATYSKLGMGSFAAAVGPLLEPVGV